MSRVDLDGRRIDFRLVREGDDLLARAMKDKGATGRDAPARSTARDEAAPDAGTGARRGRKRSESSANGAARKSAGGAARGAAGKATASKRSFKTRR